MEAEQDITPPPDPYDPLAAILWGKYDTPSNYEFWRRAKPVDLSRFLNPGTNIVPHVLYDGVVFSALTGRGYVAAKNHLVINENDIILASFPKTGKTWLQEIVYNIWNKDDIDKPLSENIDVRIPHTEFPECGFEDLISRPSPKLLNSQLPYNLLPPGNCDKKYKIIYITRNPKDTAVSYYYFAKVIAMDYNGTLKEYLDLFLNDCVMAGPFGSHVLSYWNQRHQSNILFLKYEDLKKDMPMEIRKIAEFLNVEVDVELVNKIANKCSFQKMSEEPMSNHSQWTKGIDIAKQNLKFMRKGEVGDWKSHLDEETNRRFDEWIEKNFANTDLTFDYEI